MKMVSNESEFNIIEVVRDLHYDAEICSRHLS